MTLSAMARPKSGMPRRAPPMASRPMSLARVFDHVGLAAVLAVALLAVEDRVGTDPIVAHVVVGHAFGHSHLPPGGLARGRDNAPAGCASSIEQPAAKVKRDARGHRPVSPLEQVLPAVPFRVQRLPRWTIPTRPTTPAGRPRSQPETNGHTPTEPDRRLTMKVRTLAVSIGAGRLLAMTVAAAAASRRPRRHRAQMTERPGQRRAKCGLRRTLTPGAVLVIA